MRFFLIVIALSVCFSLLTIIALNSQTFSLGCFTDDLHLMKVRAEVFGFKYHKKNSDSEYETGIMEERISGVKKLSPFYTRPCRDKLHMKEYLRGKPPVTNKEP